MYEMVSWLPCLSSSLASFPSWRLHSVAGTAVVIDSKEHNFGPKLWAGQNYHCQHVAVPILPNRRVAPTVQRHLRHPDGFNIEGDCFAQLVGGRTRCQVDDCLQTNPRPEITLSRLKSPGQCQSAQTSSELLAMDQPLLLQLHQFHERRPALLPKTLPANTLALLSRLLLRMQIPALIVSIVRIQRMPLVAIQHL